MASIRWDKRFLASTRGRIVALLRREDGTVNDLAEALDLTTNAVRAHLASLERDGLIEQRGVRRGTGKPANVYGLADEAERLFPKAYSAVLGHLLDVLADRMDPCALETVLAEVGRRVVDGQGVPDGDAQARLEAAVTVIGELGGLAELDDSDGATTIRGYSCPFSALMPDHPGVCRIAEALVAEVVGVPVRQACQHGSRPQCVFEVAAAEAGGA